MAGLNAVNQVGESLVALLRGRRDLLSAQGQLGPIPATLSIEQASLARLATQAEPTVGCTLTCWRVSLSDHPGQRGATGPAGRASLFLELHYLLTAWAATPAEEQSTISWAMLELKSYPVLDRSLLPRDGSWSSDEIVQIAPDSMTDDALFRLWGALQRRLRLCATFRARVVRIDYGPTPDFPPVVATRFGFADQDALLGEGV